MGYTFKNICISNFKYIAYDRELKIDLTNGSIVILDGQNGYGKTTLFDAIEILITGGIKHFKSGLQNRKVETLGTLANNPDKDIVISATLISDTDDEICIKRRLVSRNEFKSYLELDDHEITQEELYDKLCLSSNMFDIGTYISQSESLDFLKNKYKDRKASVSSLLDNVEIIDKISALETVQQCIEDRVKSENDDRESKISETKKKIDDLENQSKQMVTNSDLPGDNIRLFSDVEYDFDVVNRESGVAYNVIIQKLDRIEEFVQNYDEYIKYNKNDAIKSLERFSEKEYMALFYRKEIRVLGENEEVLRLLNRVKELLRDYEQNIWTVDEKIFSELEVDAQIVDQIKNLLICQRDEKSKLDEAGAVLAQMTKTREKLINEFHSAAASGKFERNKCPLCGTRIEDIDAAIAETTQFIEKIHTDGINALEKIEKEIAGMFSKRIMPALLSFAQRYNELIQMNDKLAECKNLSIDKLRRQLDSVKLSEFESKQVDKFEIEEFLEAYKRLQKQFKESIIPCTIDIKPEQIELYKSIHSTYYHNKKPYHKVEELHSKKQYVAKLFSDSLVTKLAEEKKKYKNLIDVDENYKKKAEVMTSSVKTLIEKYKGAQKEYQTQLTSAIKIPLMVYSGRIIQNYPLGLGVRAVVKENQLVFDTVLKSGNDVYNILSTGQLNGLSISLLLAIKHVYGNADGLDVLLIDDPLQTIDDISAISLVDLLTQQRIGQIILSTHEESKANLLRYKFDGAGMNALEKNMQSMYMQIASER